jgi:predicted anti-sigma-YlaC factor YlaD
LPGLLDGSASQTEDELARKHLDQCSRCGLEYRLSVLSRATLDAAAASDAIVPDDDFFKAVRARIHRGPGARLAETGDESWAAALLFTARRLMPAMALLLLMIIGATLLWNTYHSTESVSRTVVYELQPPNPDDSLESIIALEDRRNGK